MNVDGTDLVVQYAPDDALFTESPTWVTLDGVRNVTSASSGRTTEIDQAQPGFIEALANNRTRSVDLAYGPAKVTFDGSGSDYWSCGDLAAFSGATQLDVRAAVSADDWTPAAAATIAAQWLTTGSQRCWHLFVDTSGYLALQTSTDGGAGSISVNSGCRVSAVDGQTICVRATWQSTNAVYFYVKRTRKGRERADCLSHDGWSQLGAVKVGVAAALFNSTAVVTVGDRNGTTQPWDGSVLYADARTTIGSDTLAFAFWPADAATEADSSWVSSAGAGETWTKTGASTITLQGDMFNRLGSGTPVRLLAERDAVEYVVGYGYLRRAPQAFPSSGRDATVRLSAADTLAFLSDQQAPFTPSQFGTGTVGHYWPLHENQAVQQAADVVGAAPATWTATREAGGPTQPGAPGLPTQRLTTGTYLVASESAGFTFADSGAYLRFSVWLESESSTFRVFCGDGSGAVGVSYGVNGGYYWQASGAASAEVFDLRLSAGSHAFQLFDNGGGAINVQIDGALYGGTGTTTLFDTDNALYVDGNAAAVSDVALYQDAANGDAYLGATGGAGQLSGERMEALLQGSMGNVPGLWDLTTDPTTYLGPTALGTTYGELCRQVNTAEQGRFHQDLDGQVIFRSRSWTQTATAATVSQATFGDGAGEVHYADIGVDPGSREDVINDVTVTLPNGTSGNYVDRESVAAHGIRSRTFSAPLAAPADAVGLAKHIVGLRSWPQTRITNLVLNPLGDDDVWTQVLTRKIGDRITVKRRTTETTTPTSTTEPISADVVIEQITHAIDRSGTWRTTYLTTPAPPTAAEAGYFTLDDTVLGVLDAGISLAY